MKKTLTILSFLFITQLLSAQQWGAFTLYSTQNSTTAYLVDTNGTTHHSWTGMSAGTGYSSYLMPGGTLVRSIRVSGTQLSGGGMTGGVQKVAWDGTLLWNFVYSSATYCLHHDICPLPNGNVLMISYDVKTAMDATNAGSSTAHTMWSEKIMEVQPTGLNTGTVVWEWKLWDHLTQSVNAARANYNASTLNHPELLDINYSSTSTDWVHMNGIDYNPDLDQIVIGSHNLNQVFVIDHSTTTAEAASHSGGNSGKGGDFLYRWGNPASYGATGTRIFNVVHDAHFIPSDCPNAGYIVGYNNNGISATASCVDMAAPPYDGYNYLLNPGSAYAPSTYTKRINCNGHNSNMGNSQQLPNGNSLICIAQGGIIKEVDSVGNLLWSITPGGTQPQAFRYSACYVSGTPPTTPSIIENTGTLDAGTGTSFQWYENGVAIPGATGQQLIPQNNAYYSVQTIDANGCPSDTSSDFYFGTTGVAQITAASLSMTPNPTQGVVELHIPGNAGSTAYVTVVDQSGRVVLETAAAQRLDLQQLPDGIYYVRLKTADQTFVSRLAVVR